jgi:hypothetical protein
MVSTSLYMGKSNCKEYVAEEYGYIYSTECAIVTSMKEKGSNQR